MAKWKKKLPKPPPPPEQCGACKFFRVRQLGCEVGLCRRYPQAVAKHCNNWCGEWSKK